MSWAQRIDEARTTRAKLRLLGEALDELSVVHRQCAGIVPKKKLAPISERHMESVELRRIFEHWRKAMGKGNSRLTPERRKAVQARLKDGYTVEQILKAIDGCAGSDFHRAGHYTDLTLICRNGSKVEQFIAIAGPDQGERNRAFLG